MRVVSGNLRGQTFESPRGHRTHPMGDKIKGALFNMLGDINGLEVLDLYAGSGALSIEAISRGASHATAIEADKVAYATIKRSIESLGLDDVIEVHKMYVHSWFNRNNNSYDIVIADPPYDDLQFKTLDKLPSLVKTGGILVYSLPPRTRLLLSNNCQLVSEKSYGDATLSVYTVS